MKVPRLKTVPFYCNWKDYDSIPPGQPSHPFEASIYGSKHGETYRKSLHSDGLRGANKGRNISRDEWMVIDFSPVIVSDIFGLQQKLEKHWCWMMFSSQFFFWGGLGCFLLGICYLWQGRVVIHGVAKKMPMRVSHGPALIPSMKNMTLIYIHNQRSTAEKYWSNNHNLDVPRSTHVCKMALKKGPSAWIHGDFFTESILLVTVNGGEHKLIKNIIKINESTIFNQSIG